MLRSSLCRLTLLLPLLVAAPSFAGNDEAISERGGERRTVLNIGAANPGVCASPAPGAAYAIRDPLPGNWRNPLRHGTGWDLHRDEASGLMSVTWYTFDSARRPIWYRSALAQVDPNTLTWRSPIERIGLDTVTGRRMEPVAVGAASIRFFFRTIRPRSPYAGRSTTSRFPPPRSACSTPSGRLGLAGTSGPCAGRARALTLSSS